MLLNGRGVGGLARKPVDALHHYGVKKAPLSIGKQLDHAAIPRNGYPIERAVGTVPAVLDVLSPALYVPVVTDELVADRKYLDGLLQLARDRD